MSGPARKNAVANVIGGTPARQRAFVLTPIRSPQYVGTPVNNWMIGVSSATGADPDNWSYNWAEIVLGNNDIVVTAPGSRGWFGATVTRRIVGIRAKPPMQLIAKPVWQLHEVVALTNVTVNFDFRNIFHSYSPFLKITSPPSGVFTAAGQIPITVAIVQDDCFASASATQTVTVVKATPVITWSVPVPLVVVNTALGPNHLSATTDFDHLGARKPAIVYDRKQGEQLKTAGTVTITASFAGNAVLAAAAPKSVTWKVVADVGTLGKEAMSSGMAFKRPASGPKAALLNAWDTDDSPAGIKATSRKVMADIKSLTGDELEVYMDTFLLGTAGTRTPPSTPPYPGPGGKCVNVIWELPNGLQVRYKPYGDDATVQGPPMFCIEGKICVGPSRNKRQVAFKVTSDGMPGAYGHKETRLPPDIPAVVGNLTNKAYMDGACATTHLGCKPKVAQTITWKPKATRVVAGAELGPDVLNATSDAPNAVLAYTDDTGAVVTKTSRLAAKIGQLLQVTASATPTHDAVTTPVTATIDIEAKTEQPK